VEVILTITSDQEPNQPLFHQLPDAQHEDCRGRRAGDLHPEKFARRGQGIELAAGARWSDLPGDVPLLAKDDSALDPSAWRRDVETACGEDGRLKPRPGNPPMFK